MKHKHLSVIALTACVIILSVSSQASWWPFSDKSNKTSELEITEISWPDLIPDDFIQPENPFTTMSQEEIDVLLDDSAESNARLAQLQEKFDYAPVVEELDGKRVKLPAYITPLEFDGQTTVKEFLLVPYVGACMHTPPPPANQVVHADSPESIKIGNIYDAVWAIGTIRTQTVKSNLAESGYKLEVEEVLPYTE